MRNDSKAYLSHSSLNYLAVINQNYVMQRSKNNKENITVHTGKEIEINNSECWMALTVYIYHLLPARKRLEWLLIQTPLKLFHFMNCCILNRQLNGGEITESLI